MDECELEIYRRGLAPYAKIIRDSEREERVETNRVLKNAGLPVRYLNPDSDRVNPVYTQKPKKTSRSSPGSGIFAVLMLFVASPFLVMFFVFIFAAAVESGIVSSPEAEQVARELITALVLAVVIVIGGALLVIGLIVGLVVYFWRQYKYKAIPEEDGQPAISPESNPTRHEREQQLVARLDQASRQNNK